MDFENIFQNTFGNWQTIVLMLFVFIFTALIRKVVETFWKTAKENKFWREIFLPFGTILNGAWLAFLMTAPEIFSHKVLDKMMWGSICGLCAGWAYARIKAWFAVKGSNANPPQETPSQENPLDQPSTSIEENQK